MREREGQTKERVPKPSMADADLLGIRSIQFRTWLSFVALTAITLVILWSAQIIFHITSYRDMSKTEIARAGDRLFAEIGIIGFGDRLRADAIEGGFSAVVVNMNRGAVEMYASSNGTMAIDETDAELFESVFAEGGEFRRRLSSDPDGYVYIASIESRGNFIIYGRMTEGYAPRILCLIKPYTQNGSAVVVLRKQLVFATVVCMLISMFLALMFSRKLVKPITKFSATALKLGGGDFNVRFEGNGWTEIDELAETLNYATEEMGKTETLRRDFFANVSHDLRTPLTIVRAYAEMIRDISGEDPEKRAAHAQAIIDESDKLTMLVGDILELSKLQAGTNENTFAETEIGELVRSVAERFAGTAESEDKTVVGEIDCTSKVVCDKRRIEQVLYNLISNALNYSKEGGTVTVRAKETSLCVRVEVSDTGSGIPEEELKSVWDRYYRASRTKRATKGTGLGLSIVKNILTQHDARFGVESVVEGEGVISSGTTFWFELKKCESPAPIASEEKKKKGGKAGDKI